MSNPFSAKPDEGASEKLPEQRENDVSARVESKKIAAPETPSESMNEKIEGQRPSLGMDEVSCRSCRYLEFKGDSRVSVVEGECRRNAPTPGADLVASWPRVTWEGWCGEWETGVSDEDMVKMARAIAERQSDGPSGGFVKKPERHESGA